MMTQLKGKYFLEGSIECLTGLHIGGTTTGIEIGGVDNPVIKDPVKDQPYIPGSSLKGKLRSLSEWSLGLVAMQSEHKDSFGAHDCRELENEPTASNGYHKALILGKIFGPATSEAKIRVKTGPSRLIVRDAFLTDDSKQELQNILGERLYTEVKTENALDRVTSVANPRPIERVPAGGKFAFTMIMDIYDEGEHDLFKELFAAMHLLEHSSLGGSGSRGHGQICFKDLKLTWRSNDYYRNGDQEKAVPLPGSDLKALTSSFDKIIWPD